jgi:hypothetical protein
MPPRFPFDLSAIPTYLPTYTPALTAGYVADVVDGNTLDIVALVHDEWYQFRVHIRDIMVPSLRSKSRSTRFVAHAALEHMRSLVLHRSVTINNRGYDMFGRLIADVHTNNVNVGQTLLAVRLAVPYKGSGRRPYVADWILYRYNGTR